MVARLADRHGSPVHTFWHFYEPDRYPSVDPDEASRLGKLIPNLYGHNDRFLARLLAKVDENTVILVVSDHGFAVIAAAFPPSAVQCLSHLSGGFAPGEPGLMSPPAS